MARWKILVAHYLMTADPAEWEYAETNRTTGRPMRKKFTIPRYVDPRDPADWTNRWGNNKDNEEGECIVCLPGKGQEKDIEFLGDPTPDMIPLDEEAKSLSASFEARWRYKPATSEGNYSQALVDNFQAEMSKFEAVATKPVQVEGITELVAAMHEQSKLTSELLKRRV